eukprot:NODE_20_length_44879_cov_0.624654.p21 type:complete len:250 gc:universal NODE_20_length_44879_cov_0.624654:28580-29329(+)
MKTITLTKLKLPDGEKLKNYRRIESELKIIEEEHKKIKSEKDAINFALWMNQFTKFVKNEPYTPFEFPIDTITVSTHRKFPCFLFTEINRYPFPFKINCLRFPLRSKDYFRLVSEKPYGFQEFRHATLSDLGVKDKENASYFPFLILPIPGEEKDLKKISRSLIRRSRSREARFQGNSVVDTSNGDRLNCRLVYYKDVEPEFILPVIGDRSYRHAMVGFVEYDTTKYDPKLFLNPFGDELQQRYIRYIK